MHHQAAVALIERRYADVHGATPNLDFPAFATHARNGVIGAALGFRRADTGPLFLEAYLDDAIERHLSHIFQRSIMRHDIVEIGNMAAETAPAMVALWARAANDLGNQAEVAVAVLTTSLRAMLRRLGVVLYEIAPARPERLGRTASKWGAYYEKDPIVCAGLIAEGQSRLALMGRGRS
ncbi:thermostable hemolysin [soil metagenome]